ncbi:hypothetical protein ABTD91_19540, partial [Acinetobacter baumannii]
RRLKHDLEQWTPVFRKDHVEPKMFCLDTNIVISTINRWPTHIRARLESELASGVVVGVPAVVLFEMHYGAAKSDRRERS